MASHGDDGEGSFPFVRYDKENNYAAGNSYQPIDNVVVALHPIAKGTLVEVDGLSVTALEDIPQGHKMAVKPIKNGENVIKYGFPIGTAKVDIPVGAWVHTQNVQSKLGGFTSLYLRTGKGGSLSLEM